MSFSDIVVGVICYILVDEWAEKKQIGMKIKHFFRKIKSRINH